MLRRFVRAASFDQSVVAIDGGDAAAFELELTNAGIAFDACPREVGQLAAVYKLPARRLW